MTVKWYGDKLVSKMEKLQVQALKACGALLEREIKLSMKPGTGNEYVRGGKIHRASAPGQPPAVDTGRLRASITYNWSGSGRGRAPIQNPSKETKSNDGVGEPAASRHEVVVVVGTNVKYGRDLELGTTKIKPRPYLRPALENNRARLERIIYNTIQRGLA